MRNLRRMATPGGSGFSLTAQALRSPAPMPRNDGHILCFSVDACTIGLRSVSERTDHSQTCSERRLLADFWTRAHFMSECSYAIFYQPIGSGFRIRVTRIAKNHVEV